MSFEANQGQVADEVKFLSRGSGYTLFLTSTEAVLTLNKPSVRREIRESDLLHRKPIDAEDRLNAAPSVLRMKLVGANSWPQIEGVDELPGMSNHFIGNDPARWRTNVPSFGRVKYSAVYPGIDLVYYGSQRQLEYDFVVRPVRDPSRIALSFEGAVKLEIDDQGDLLVELAGGQVKQRNPIIYQELNGVPKEIAGNYVLLNGHEVGFRFGSYDRTQPLVIDPTLLYSTYLGGSSVEYSYMIAVDTSGNA